jgi:CubicO group peptidase (beta-lactamase class C family)
LVDDRHRGASHFEESPTVTVSSMRSSIGVVRGWQLVETEGDREPMHAASLTKLIIGHLALAEIEDLDIPIAGDISARHVLSHTTGLPNWRDDGQPLAPLRPPGERWGYSGEGFLLLQKHLEKQAGRSIDQLAADRVFGPLRMLDTSFDVSEPGYHGWRPLLTTGADFGRFLAHVLTIDDERWRAQISIDDELAWGAGWGLELGASLYGWQWGLNYADSGAAAANFVIGCPATGNGVVVFTDDPERGRPYYSEIVQRILPGDHPSLRVEHNQTFIDLVTS